MKVGILGSGDVAKALAAGFLEHGHSVVMGTRDPAIILSAGQPVQGTISPRRHRKKRTRSNAHG